MNAEQIIFISVIIFSLLQKKCHGQRRIVEGTKVPNEVRYMAYLVKSELTEKSYHGWTCGGAIISPLHILTAAACVIDVDHLYAIVGYKKYVSAEGLDDDACTRKRKKRVIKTCAPKSYNVEFNGWTNHDIGVAMLEAPLDFTDVTYKIDCSYPPALIKVNFDPLYEAVDTDVVAMGWGHSKKLRQPDDLQDHNEQFLREASLLIVKREVCEKKFDYDPVVEQIVGNDIICVEGQGNLNAEGKLRLDEPERSKCDPDEGKETTETAHTSDAVNGGNITDTQPAPTKEVSVDKTDKETTAMTSNTTKISDKTTATTSNTTKTSEKTTSTITTTAKTTTKTTTTTVSTTTKRKKIEYDVRLENASVSIFEGD